MTASFQPTHYLVSRSRKVPVRVISGEVRSQIFTEREWLDNQEPAFELYAKLGLYCRGVQIVGYHLEPLAAPAPASASMG
ncbi:MAG: hypothetical protein ICV77_05000 [Cyanobacteria bacterium Co-bin8]|nr:hypothetical protein [Cyanobacteria bacterium Co-bin8]